MKEIEGLGSLRVSPVEVQTSKYENFELTIAKNSGVKVLNFQFSLNNQALQNIVFRDVLMDACTECVEELKRLDPGKMAEFDIDWLPELGMNQWCASFYGVEIQPWNERFLTVIFPTMVNTRYGESIDAGVGPMDLNTQDRKNMEKEDPE